MLPKQRSTADCGRVLARLPQSAQAGAGIITSGGAADLAASPSSESAPHPDIALQNMPSGKWPKPLPTKSGYHRIIPKSVNARAEPVLCV